MSAACVAAREGARGGGGAASGDSCGGEQGPSQRTRARSNLGGYPKLWEVLPALLERTGEGAWQALGWPVRGAHIMADLLAKRLHMPMMVRMWAAAARST